MKDQGAQNTSPQPDPANLSQSELVSNQEETAVPWFCGQMKIALTWISPAYNIYETNADSGKK